MIGRRELAGLALALAVITPRITAQEPPPRAGGPPAGPPCTISSDPDFGVKAEKAIRVGGGAMTVAAREQRYLASLRGPNGQLVTYKRIGSTTNPAGGPGPLDMYTSTYEGAPAPITLYVDAYHFDEPSAPQGFTCVAFTLGPPPVDPFLAQDQAVRLAVEQGATREFTPISLDADGSSAHGVALDRFRMIARASHAATERGAPLDPTSPRLPAGTSLVVFAYPLRCGERVVTPTAIEILSPQGQSARHEPPQSGATLAELAPGFAVPDGSVGTRFTLSALRPNDIVQIEYADSVCTGSEKQARLPVRATGARPASLPPPATPAGLTTPASPIWLQAIIDVEGRFQQASFIGGPQGFEAPALAAIRDWRAEPMRINGTPVTSETLLVVRFK